MLVSTTAKHYIYVIADIEAARGNLFGGVGGGLAGNRTNWRAVTIRTSAFPVEIHIKKNPLGRGSGQVRSGAETVISSKRKIK